MLLGHARSLVFVDIAAIGDTHQGIMGLIHIRRCEQTIISRHQRNIECLGELDKIILGPRLFRRAVTHDFHVESAREQPVQALNQLFRRRFLARQQQMPDRPLIRTGEAQQPLGTILQAIECDMRFMAIGAGTIGLGQQP